MSPKNRIDYSKYQVDELIETISDVILFPIYIGRVLISVILFFILLIGVLSYYCTNYFLTFIPFFLLSFIVTFPSIIIISVVRIINTIRDDINKVLQICVDTSVYIYKDSLLISKQQQSDLPISVTFGDVFKGVALYVIRPSLKKVLEKRIKFMAAPFVFLIDLIFKLVILKKQKNIDKEPSIQADLIKKNEAFPSLDQKIKHKGNNLTRVTMRAITVPFYLILLIYGFLNLLLIWLFSFVF